MDFDFDTWATENGLTEKTMTLLKKEDLASKNVLMLLTDDDLKDIKLTVGQTILFKNLLRELKWSDMPNDLPHLCYKCKSPVRDRKNSVDTESTVDPTQAWCDGDDVSLMSGCFYELPARTATDFYKNSSLDMLDDTESIINVSEYGGKRRSLSSFCSEILKKSEMNNGEMMLRSDMSPGDAMLKSDVTPGDVMLTDNKRVGIVDSISFQGNHMYINCKYSYASELNNAGKSEGEMDSPNQYDIYFELALPPDLVARTVLELLISDFSKTLH